MEHGLADEWAPNASRFALEGRAFPFLIFDPDAGATIADCMDLSGNPDLDQTWPTYELEYVDEEGQAQKMELPVTTADWAATEGRFKKHFKRIKPEEWNEDQVLFHEFIDLSEDERVGKTPFIWVIDGEKKLGRLACSMEMVLLGEDRLLYWSQLRELAGLEVPASVRADIADDMEAEFEAKAAAIRTDYEAQLAELRMSYPALVARRMAEGLLASGDGNLTVAEILARANADPDLQPITAEAVAGLAGGLGVDVGGGNGGATVTVAPAEAVTRAVAIAEAAEVTGVSVAPAVAEPEAAEPEAAAPEAVPPEAEPVAEEASEIAAEGRMIENSAAAMEGYANGLRYTVALSVGLAIVMSTTLIVASCGSAPKYDKEIYGDLEKLDPSGQVITYWHQHSRDREEVLQGMIDDLVEAGGEVPALDDLDPASFKNRSQHFPRIVRLVDNQYSSMFRML